MRATALHVSYTGLLEPLGLSQVVAYAERLSRDHGHRIEILSFEKTPTPAPEVRRLLDRLESAGIPWHRRTYHRRPRNLATAIDVATGVRSVLARAAVRPIFVHARSHVPAFMADIVRSLAGVPFIFDHRGLLAEEYADAGIWKRGGQLYKLVMSLERRFLRRADAVVVLTDMYRRELALGDKCVTIPCAVDLQTYRLRPDVRPVYDLVYAGSWSGLYLAEETIGFFRAFRRHRPSARILLLIPYGQRLPSPEPGIDSQHATPEEVPARLAEARAGLSLRRPGPAQRAASPVKLSEYLATGLPAVTSAGVGDTEELFKRTGTGVVLPGFSEPELDRGARDLVCLLDTVPTIAARCRQVAEETFGLDAAVGTYSSVYSRMERMTTPDL